MCCRADDDVNDLDVLEVNEALVRLAVMYGPRYVSLVGLPLPVSASHGVCLTGVGCLGSMGRVV